MASPSLIDLCGKSSNEKQGASKSEATKRDEGTTKPVWIQPKPKLCYYEPKIILNQQSENRPEIFKGYYEGSTLVAIQEIKNKEGMKKEIEREFQILRQLENHENFIRYFCCEEDTSSTTLYIATELCACSVADLYDPKTIEHNAKSQDILQTLRPKTILFQATRGLEYLHSHGYLHRNVKPSSFLIKELVARNKSCSQYVIKITDFRLSRKVVDGEELSGNFASDAWEAPESRIPKKPVEPSLDVFLLGCFFHFVIVADEYWITLHERGHAITEQGTLTDKSSLHPFGSDWRNIPKKTHRVYQEGWTPEIYGDNKAAVPLIKSMLRFEPSERPSLSKVLEDAFFQPASREMYPMYSYEKPGYCVIFNQEKFKMSDGTEHQRIGSQQDCTRLTKTFRELGYEVNVFENLHSNKLKSEIEKLAKRDDWTRYGSLVVCLLSHGTEGHILCSDNVLIKINSLRTVFSLYNCPGLYGKPKIFIVQACRSPHQTSWISELIKLTIKKIRGLWNVFYHLPFGEENHAPRKITEGPPLLDFLTIYATLPEVVAYRFEDAGSPFIQALCDGLRNEYLSDEGNGTIGKQDLESVLRGDRGVQGLVNRRKKWQTMEWEACLSKYICFQKCQPEALSNQTSIAIDTAPFNLNTRLQLVLAVLLVFVSVLYLIFTARCD